MRRGTKVQHPQLGPGTVVDVVGGEVLVDFYGERIGVPAGDLTASQDVSPGSAGDVRPDQLVFRRAFEAINLGVVPPDPLQMLTLSIGGDQMEAVAADWLRRAHGEGLCKVVFGDYGTGKTHHLKVIQAAALRQGWVVAFVEFDPKQADPAKPHLVYRAVMNSLRFPAREDEAPPQDFVGFLDELRRKWRQLAPARHYLSQNPWYRLALEVLTAVEHSEDTAYLTAAAWLAGDGVPQSAVRSLMVQQGLRLPRPPAMPRTRETAEIYVFHLVVLHWLLRALKYRGLLVLFDEAEHVRGFNVRRRERANNLFDWLARCARPPEPALPEPIRNEHVDGLPPFWREGPHFGLIVGLTEGETFSRPSESLRDACVFLRDEGDMLRLQPPCPDEYARWCEKFLGAFTDLFPSDSAPIRTPEARMAVVAALRDEFARVSAADRNLRLWTKAAGFIPALLMARVADNADELASVVRECVRDASGQVLPWESMS